MKSGNYYITFVQTITSLKYIFDAIYHEIQYYCIWAHAATVTARVRHGYGYTRGYSKTGSVGTGTVFDFGTPWHTAYPYCGVTGMYGYITIR